MYILTVSFSAFLRNEESNKYKLVTFKPTLYSYENKEEAQAKMYDALSSFNKDVFNQFPQVCEMNIKVGELDAEIEIKHKELYADCHIENYKYSIQQVKGE